jgi:hypothetical protein
VSQDEEDEVAPTPLASCSRLPISRLHAVSDSLKTRYRCGTVPDSHRIPAILIVNTATIAQAITVSAMIRLKRTPYYAYTC